MNTAKSQNQAPGDAAPAVMPVALDRLAARFRPSGLFLLALNSDGTIAHHDSQAEDFFQRYVLPMLQWREKDNADSDLNLSTITETSNIAVWDFVPGVTMAAFAESPKNSGGAIIVLAGKSPAFSLTETISAACSRLGIDGNWLNTKAEALPAYDQQAIQRQAKLLLGMVRDQMRVASLEQEVESLSGQLTNTYEELSLIYQLSSGMRVNRKPREFFKQACLDLMNLIDVRGMGITLRIDNGPPEPPVLYGSLSLPPGMVNRLANELIELFHERQSPLLINHVSRDKDFKWLGQYAHQLLAVPLVRHEQVLGCLFGLDKIGNEFDSVDSKLLNSIANESAIYLENSMLYEDARGLLMGLLHSLVSAVDAKDEYTCGHSERVALMSRLLAQQAKLGEHFVDRVYMAGLLHDVGKIGVPEAVLQKTGRLTAEEFAQIKKHPEIGARILRDIKQIEDIVPGVLHHHERYDGKGYPAGLAGENIPLMGRLICVADCFDAMTSSRTYRKALPLEAAMAEMRRCSGTQFDPVLTDAFLSIGAERIREVITDHKHQIRQLIEMQQALRAA